MSEEKSKEQQLVEAISGRFLKDGSNFSTLKEILDAPLVALKGMDAKNASLLEEAAFISKVQDLIELDPEKPFFSMMQGKGVIDDPIKFSMLKKNIIERLQDRISVALMRDMVIAARLISRAEKKREFYIKEKQEQKILFLGLDNAGKTAIINVLSGKINMSTFQKLKPTKRVQREKVVTKDLEIFIWDLGGQKEYRDTYLKRENLEMFFLQTDMIVYVIDMQDPVRFDESMEYLKDILHTLDYLNENPFILFFLHKSDPDIISNVDFQLNLETLKDKLLALIEPYDFDYDAYPTSIYNLYSKEAKFSKFIKGVLEDQKSEKAISHAKKDPIKAMGEVLDTAMNLTVNLANTFQEEIQKVHAMFRNVEARLQALEAGTGHPGIKPSGRTTPQQDVARPAKTQAEMAGLPPGISPPPSISSTPSIAPTGGNDQPTSMISRGGKEGQHQNVRGTIMS
ncbi:hypothetical protein GF325_17040, partial [Candidatus Bathyarchaeota archaeon]|nr:hypothetical protein [Candidatus Bathyarchaeota archaeon]